MTAQRGEWSVLTKSAGPAGSAVPSPEQTRGLLERLPGADKWIQYPPASGRGHAFETRFWLPASDACDAAERGVALVEEAQAGVGLADWLVVRLHSASLDERAIEYYPGLEARPPGDADWSVMHRVLLPDDGRALDAGDQERLLGSIPGPDKLASVAGRILELRFWVAGDDAVDAAARAESVVGEALTALGRGAWTTVRIQTASAPERRREMYLGVERRLHERDGT